jgi:hypothetical protein
MASATILKSAPELTLLSASVRRCTPVAVALVTQLDTQPLEIAQVVEALRLWREGPLIGPRRPYLHAVRSGHFMYGAGNVHR